MSDRLARKLGLSKHDLAALDRLLDLMPDDPQPPAGGPEDDPEPVSSRGLVFVCALGLLIAIALAVWVEVVLVLS